MEELLSHHLAKQGRIEMEELLSHHLAKQGRIEMEELLSHHLAKQGNKEESRWKKMRRMKDRNSSSNVTNWCSLKHDSRLLENGWLKVVMKVKIFLEDQITVVKENAIEQVKEEQFMDNLQASLRTGELSDLR